MKLSRPASSSDLEAAREIARRLHKDPAEDRGTALPRSRPIAAARPAAASRPTAGRPAARQVEPPPQARADAPMARPARTPSAPQPPRARRDVQAPPRAVAPAAVEPEPEPAPAPTPAPAFEPAPSAAFEPALSPEFEPATEEPEREPWDEPATEGPAPEQVDALESLGAGPEAAAEMEPGSEDSAIEIEDSGATLEEVVGSTGGVPAEDLVGEPASIADALEQESAEAVEPPEPAPGAFDPGALPAYGEPAEVDTVSEELFDVPPPPSWGEIVEACMEIAHARGAMLVDPGGRVVAARGNWPSPGAEAIAGRLVSMMEKTLKDAPTRSVSAPVGGQHLTAWRVPLTEGLVTAAFIADAPLRSEARTPIDAQILSGGSL